MKTKPRFNIPADFDLSRVEAGPVQIHRHYQIGPTRGQKLEWFAYGFCVGLMVGVCLMMFVASKLP